MTQKFTEEEVRANIAANRRYMTTETELQLTAYADTLSKPADSGRVGDAVVSALDRALEAVNAQLLTEKANERAAWEAVSVLQSHGAIIRAALAAQRQGEAERKFFARDFYEEAREGKKAWPGQCDSGRVDRRVKVGQLVGAELERAWFAICDALSEIDPDWMMYGPVGVEAAVAKIRALAAQGQGDGEPAAWRIHTDDDVERVAKAAGWDNRRYMTPADYAIWCVRMREFVRLAVTRPAPPASPAGVPDCVIVLLNHLETLMDEGKLAEDAIPTEMWNAVSMQWLRRQLSAPEGDGGGE